MLINIERRFSGHVLFSHDVEGNTLKATVEAAVKKRAYLRDAYLRRADLRGAYLRGAYLRDADLRDADLRGANLRGADLRDADLRDAYLRGANLGGADLGGAYLRDADLGGEKLTKAPLSLLSLRWPILITEAYLTIGCQRHTHEAWWNFSDDEIAKMSDGALEWWRQWKGALVLLCDAHSGKSGELQGFSAAKGEAA